MSSPTDVLGELRGMVAQGAAKIRAMSDGELVTRFLELGGGMPTSEPEAPTPRPRKPRAPKAPPAKATASASTQKAESDARKARVLEHLRIDGGYLRGADLARAMNEVPWRVAHSLVLLAREGLAESNGKGGKGCAYRAVGRQKGAKPKVSKPSSTDDEEPGLLEPDDIEVDVDDLEEDVAEIPAPPDSEPSTIDTSTARMLGPARPTYRQSLAAGTGLDENDPHLARLLRLEAGDGDEESNDDEGEDVEVDDGEERRPAKLRIAPAPIVNAPRLACVGADESDALRRRVVAEIGARQPVTWGEVARALQLDSHARANIFPALLKRRVVFARGLGLGAVLALREDLLEEVSGVHRLPAFEVGAGERREDCQGYDGCLDRFTKLKIRRGRLPYRGQGISRPNEYVAEVPGHCPHDCSFYEPIPKHVRHGLATAGGSHPLANPR